jgi:hypothetical protein
MTVSRAGVSCEKVISTPIAALGVFSTTWYSGETPVAITAAEFSGTVCSGPNNDLCEDTTLRRLTEVASGTAYAHPFEVYWQSSDLYSFSEDYASSLAAVIKVPFTASTSSNNTPPASTSPPTNPTNPTNQGSGLSPGAIAGIAVGIGSFVILGIVFLLYLRRRKQQRKRQHPNVVELEGSSRGLKHFMGGKWRAEQDGSSQPVEAESRSVMIVPGPPVELDSRHVDRGRLDVEGREETVER